MNDETMTYQNKNVILNKNHNNANIKIKILSDSEMRKFGFTDFSGENWYYCKPVFVSPHSEITFNISIKKNNPKEWQIDVLDEAFCQPYDYQYFIEKGNPPKAALDIRDNVERIMKTLEKAGIISGHKFGDYI